MPEYEDRETVPFALRRRSAESRAAYIAEKVPIIAKRFNCTEGEARALLEGVSTGVAGIDELPELREPKVTPAVGSISFVLERPDDETLKFSIEFAGQGGEEITTATYDAVGSSGMGLIEDTVKSIAEALGIEVVER